MSDERIRVELRAAEVSDAVRERLRAGGLDVSGADVRFEQVGERHLDGIDVRASVVGVRRVPRAEVDGFPRRARIDLYSPAELAIREAMLAVEVAGAHPLLTEAVILLGRAKDRVADFVERESAG